ncbi:hypothetical protein [Clostridium botulinum]|uniref:hypothetical protein n=1 Tax=Clostridium botulinum TaxID=1491 RepID=UPI001F1FC11A|nr:hypothetical protein [Clostridium botulinum]
MKPSEFEIDEVIKVSRNLKSYILNESTKENSDIKDIITNEKYNSLKNLDISTLSDCKVIASECLNIALLLQKEKHLKVFPINRGFKYWRSFIFKLISCCNIPNYKLEDLKALKSTKKF